MTDRINQTLRGPRYGALLLWAWLSLFVGAVCAEAPRTPVPPAAAIASAHPLATTAGFDILAAGGNAFDAAVAVSAALAVVEPYSSGIGGGGFWLLHRAADGFETMLDGRERAPLAATRTMYLDAKGEVVPDLSMDGALAAGIPGEPAALAHLAEKYGRLPLSQSLAPAIRYAREGFVVDEYYRRLAEFRLDALNKSSEAAQIFLNKGKLPELGYRVLQPDLAVTLEALAREGHAGFYSGEVAKRLIKGVRAAGGIWTAKDLEDYRVVEREPIRGEYHGINITTAAPPSSGGVVLVTMLNILAGYDLAALDDVTRTHVIVEAMRRAYRDRADYLGDPDFVSMPIARLTHPFYAEGLRASIRLDRATPSTDLPGAQPAVDGPHTTHFSILDSEGNRVAATLSINYPFGAAMVVPGTGVLLNDEMDDFSAKPGVPNAYGLVGAEANAIAPGKRMLSSMTPTFMETADRVAILGTPGGSRIISMLLLGGLEFAAGEAPQAWVTRPRFHHQYLPDVIQFEPGAFDALVQEDLNALGHKLSEQSSSYGNMQAVLWEKATGKVDAASDPRGVGSAEVRGVVVPQMLAR
ncbi:MAG: gamma-glutamyltransferase [Gammaproteobacteria bacterium]|nr:gamma-glutamyltransferase [Gammaproteobacteria bacterium]